jgi:hypothetical protein
VIVHAGIGVEAVAAAMVIAADIGEHTGATLCNPDVPALRVVAPCPVQDAGAAGNLVDELRLAERAGPAFAVLVMTGMAFDGGLGLRRRRHPQRHQEDGGGKEMVPVHRFAPFRILSGAINR